MSWTISIDESIGTIGILSSLWPTAKQVIRRRCGMENQINILRIEPRRQADNNPSQRDCFLLGDDP